jgi:hypothetical protein
MTNKHRKVWKVISRKPLSGKQTWPKILEEDKILGLARSYASLDSVCFSFCDWGCGWVQFNYAQNPISETNFSYFFVAFSVSTYHSVCFV